MNAFVKSLRSREAWQGLARSSVEFFAESFGLGTAEKSTSLMSRNDHFT